MEKARIQRGPRSGRAAKAAVTLFIAAVSFSLSMLSLQNFFYRGKAPVDSGVFRTMAMLIARGYTPYLDFFDHKGPLLYVINLAGYCIDRVWGSWLMEWLLLAAALVLFYKTARLCCGPLVSCVVLLFATVDLTVWLDGGNYTEEFALPLLGAAVYIFLDYFCNARITNVRLLALGAAFGGVLMLRPNMAVVWVVFCLAVTVQCLRQGRFAELARFAAWFLAGTALAVAPFLIWLAAKGALGAFWQAYIGFNLAYSQTTVKDIYKVFRYFLNDRQMWFCLAVLLYGLWRKRDAFLTGWYLGALFFSLLMASISGREYPHYGIILVPLFVWPLAVLLAGLERSAGRETFAAMMAACWLMAEVLCPQWFALASRVITNIGLAGQNNLGADTVQVLEAIDEYTQPEDKIIVHGSDCALYELSGREPASKYMYQFPIAGVSEEIRTAYYHELEENRPKLIVANMDVYDLPDFVAQNGYVPCLENDTYTVYLRK